jgi:hypothetical protein
LSANKFHKVAFEAFLPFDGLLLNTPPEVELVRMRQGLYCSLITLQLYR